MNICTATPRYEVAPNLGYIEENGDCEGGEDVGEDPQLGAVAHLQGPVQYWSVMHSQVSFTIIFLAGRGGGENEKSWTFMIYIFI